MFARNQAAKKTDAPSLHYYQVYWHSFISACFVLKRIGIVRFLLLTTRLDIFTLWLNVADYFSNMILASMDYH